MISTVTSLNGTWILATDPDNAGVREEWFRHPSSTTVSVKVPSIIQEAFPAYHGVVWYWREFQPAAKQAPGERVLLRFWAVDYLADVWVNGQHAGGHEGGETPFTLDITDLLAHRSSEPVLLAVRVLNPTNEPIDGIILAQTPHRNKAVPHYVGGSYNIGGITESVELLTSPAARITDLWARGNMSTSVVDVDITMLNALARPLAGNLTLRIAPSSGGEVLSEISLPSSLAPGETHIRVPITVRQPHPWDLPDPFLYRITARLEVGTRNKGIDQQAVRCGFRDFQVLDGFFVLNGRRVFIRSTHTGNHCPIGQINSPAAAPDLLQRDLLYAKAAGFNMVRFISGVAHPWQLDLCDEIGLLVYEESYASWVLSDSPDMARRFDQSLGEMVLRDRSHPSVVIWGLLNETRDGPVFRHAVESLALVRSLDDSRLVLLSSGRWDCQPAIGSLSNPGGSQWEHQWGIEAPGALPVSNTGNRNFGGYFDDAGDAHVYPTVPHGPATVQFLRRLGQATKPVFLSEYGIGSTLNAIRELRYYEQSGTDPHLEDAELMRSMAEHFAADWDRYGMDGVYPFPEDMLRESQRLHARQRLLGFDAIRSNPQLCGYNLTGMLDHGMTGEGLWTFWREWKPGIVDALRDGWAPLRWCLFADPVHGYANQPMMVESVLANEDVLVPGSYPAHLKVIGPAGIAWDRRVEVRIVGQQPGTHAPLAIQVQVDSVTLPEPGEYQFAANLLRGGAPAGGHLKFRLSQISNIDAAVATWGINGHVIQWLEAHGVRCHEFDLANEDPSAILVGDLSTDNASEAQWDALVSRVHAGSSAVFLSPLAFRRGDDPVGWLPLATRGRCYAFYDWLYHKECVARAHPFFAGMTSPGIMDWDYYGPVIPQYVFDGQARPEEVVAVSFAVGYSCPGGYASGLLAGIYRLGAGRLVLNTFRILENVSRHPAADQLLLNIVTYACTPASAAANRHAGAQRRL